VRELEVRRLFQTTPGARADVIEGGAALLPDRGVRRLPTRFGHRLAADGAAAGLGGPEGCKQFGHGQVSILERFEIASPVHNAHNINAIRANTMEDHIFAGYQHSQARPDIVPCDANFRKVAKRVELAFDLVEHAIGGAHHYP
jgi:hypothetical protein